MKPAAADRVWAAVTAGLAAKGWYARVVDAGSLRETGQRVGAALDEAGLAWGPSATGFDEELSQAARVELPDAIAARSVLVGAVARPLTQATLLVQGVARTFAVPPHYAGYHELPRRFAALAARLLSAHGFRAEQARLPLKTLAVGAGLARYGSNNLAYVEGLGSYLLLAACVTDAPPPPGAVLGEAARLGRCAGCSACRHACPTGAISGERFVLRAGRCLTAVNESANDFPEWVDPGWHTCAVGCLRCQQVCPENATVELRVAPPELFDEAESREILEGRPATSGRTRKKLVACGLDYAPAIMARNLRVLVPPARA